MTEQNSTPVTPTTPIPEIPEIKPDNIIQESGIYPE